MRHDLPENIPRFIAVIPADIEDVIDANVHDCAGFRFNGGVEPHDDLVPFRYACIRHGFSCAEAHEAREAIDPTDELQAGAEPVR